MTAMPVTVSARAAKRIAAILEGEGQPRHAAAGGDRRRLFRLPVQFRPGRDPAGRRPGASKKDGAKILIDPVSLDFLAGAEIDFTDDLIGQAFKVNNPNATSSCGCGTSFSV